MNKHYVPVLTQQLEATRSNTNNHTNNSFVNDSITVYKTEVTLPKYYENSSIISKHLF